MNLLITRLVPGVGLPRRPITAVIPEQADQQGHRKRRGLATRYDNLAVSYRGAVVLRAITLWFKKSGDTPNKCREYHRQPAAVFRGRPISSG